MLQLTHARARRHAWWWLAVFLLGVLAPGISAALAHARGDFSAWQDICSTGKSARKATDPQPIEAALDLLTQGHCPSCHITAADLAPPPAAPVLALRVELMQAAPERFWSAPATAHAWRPAAARAPPSQA